MTNKELKDKVCPSCKIDYISSSLQDISDYEMSTEFVDSIMDLVIDKVDEVNSKVEALELLATIKLVDAMFNDESSDADR